MHRHEDDHPYVSETNYLSDARPGPMQRRVAGAIIALCLALVLLFSLTGCYGTAIDTRSITADEVTISQNTTWLTGTTLTIAAKGWKSDVRGQPLSAAGAAPGAVPAPERANPAADSPSHP